MNTQIMGSKRPKLHWPKALLSSGSMERPSPTLSAIELRRIVAEMTG